MKELLEMLKIVGVAILSAVVYGIVHDQITARVCVEYFSVAHPAVFGDTQSPTLLGLGWGVIATWWVGVLIGVPLAICARVGRLPRVGVGKIARLLPKVLVGLMVVAMMAGACGYAAYRNGKLPVPEIWGEAIPAEHHGGFMFDACAHLASYGVGALCGIGMCAYVLWKRWPHHGAGMARMEAPHQVG